MNHDKLMNKLQKIFKDDLDCIRVEDRLVRISTYQITPDQLISLLKLIDHLNPGKVFKTIDSDGRHPFSINFKLKKKKKEKECEGCECGKSLSDLYTCPLQHDRDEEGSCILT